MASCWVGDHITSSKACSWLGDHIKSSKAMSWLEDHIKSSNACSWLGDHIKSSKASSWLEDHNISCFLRFSTGLWNLWFRTANNERSNYQTCSNDKTSIVNMLVMVRHYKVSTVTSSVRLNLTRALGKGHCLVYLLISCENWGKTTTTTSDTISQEHEKL